MNDDANIKQTHTTTAHTTQTKKCCRKRAIVISVLSTLLGLVLLVLLLPTLLSTSWGAGLIAGQVNSRMAGEVRMGRLSLGWFSGQRIENVVIHDKARSVDVVTIKAVDLPGVTLWQWLSGGRALGVIRIDEPIVHVERLADGSLNLAQVFAPPGASGTATQSRSSGGGAAGAITLPADLSGRLQITNGRIIFKQTSAEVSAGQPSEVRDLQVDVNLVNTQAMEGLLTAKLQQGATQGQVQVKFNADQLSTPTHQLQWQKARVDAQMELANLPVALVEVFTGQPGRLRELLGDQVTGKATMAGDVANLSAELSATSANASLTLQAQRVTKNDASMLTIKPGSQVRLTLTPSALTAWSTPKSASDQQAVKLLQPTSIELVFEDVQLGEKHGRIMPAQTSGTVRLAIGEAAVDLGEPTGVVTLRDSRGLVELKGSAQPVLTAQLRAKAVVQGKTGQVNADVRLRDFYDVAGQLRTDKLTGSAMLDVRNWPVALVDALAKTDGLLVEALGPTVDMSLQGDMALDSSNGKPTGPVKLSINTKQLRGEIAGQLDEKGLTIPTGQQLTYRAEPKVIGDLLARFSKEGSALGQVKLTGPAELQLTLGETRLPLQGNPLTGLQTQITLTATALDFTGLATLDSLRLDDTRLALTYDAGKRAMNADMDASAIYAGEKAPVGMTLQFTDLIDAQGKFTPATMQGTVIARADNVHSSFIDTFVSMPEFGVNALGKNLNLHLSADIKPAASAKAKLPNAHYVFMAVADKLVFKAQGQIDEQNITLQTSEPARFTIEPALIEVLRKHQPNLASALDGRGLVQAATITLDPLRLHLPRTTNDVKSSLRFSGKVNVNRLSITGDERLAGVDIVDLSLDLLDTTLAQGIDAKLTASVMHQRQTGRVLANIKLNDLLGNAPGGPVFKVPARLDNFPVSVIDQFMNQPGKYAALLGDKLDRVEVIDLSNTQVDRRDYGFNVLIQSEQVSGPIKGHFKPGEVAVVDEGSRLTINITPQRFPFLQKHWLSSKADDKALVLVEPTSIELAVNQAQVRFAQPVVGQVNETLQNHTSANKPEAALAINPEQSMVKLAVTAQPMRWRLPAKQLEVNVSELSAELGGTNLAQEQTLQLRSAYQVRSLSPANAGAAPQIGQLTSTTRLRQLFDAQGRFNAANLGFATQTNVTALPVTLLDEMMGQQGKLIAALGPSVDVEVNTQYDPGQGGPLQARISSAHLNTRVAGDFDKDMVLSLREDAQLTFNVSSELAQQYLASVNFLLRDAQSSRGPVRLTLSRDGFRWPLRSMGRSMDKAVLNGWLELGTLRVKRGPGGELVGLLRLAGARIENRDEFDAMFSPLSFNLKEGLLTCSDLWMDTGDLRIGSQSRVFLTGKPTTPWGEVLLAIPGDTVLVVPGTRGRIDPKAIYTVGSVGPLNAIKPDLASLIKRIVAPVAGQAVGGDIGTAIGIGSAIFGAVSEGRRQPDQRDPDWFARATWPNRPALQVPAVTEPAPGGTTPSPSTTQPSTPQSAIEPQPAAQSQPAQGQPQQPAGNQPTAKPEEEIIRGLLQGLTQPRRERKEQR